MKSLYALPLLLFSVVALAMTPEARQSFLSFERRAEGGDAEAQYRLSGILERGYDSIAPDSARALSLLRRSAGAGYAPAMNYLGFLFQNGYVTPSDTLLHADADSVVYWLSHAADAGEPRAAHNLAFLLLSDNPPVSADTLSPLCLLNRAVEAGLPQSLTLLADVTAKGRFEAPDTARAVKLYEKAIAAGFHDAEIRLLNMMGPCWRLYDSRASLSEALRYISLGANTIAVQLLLQVGPADPETARAYALLGNAYSLGRGAPYDHRRANEYFARAAILGDPAASFILAETLEIFPDALTDLLPELPESLSPESLRAVAARAGIHTAEQASRSLVSPL